MTAIEPHNFNHQNDMSLSSGEEVDDESAESLLASVREQEQQFALLTKEIEEERKTVANQLNNSKSGYQPSNEQQTHYKTPDGDYVSESYTHEEDYSEPQEETEIFIDENGIPKAITKRTVTKTVTEKKVRHVQETGSLPGNNHSHLSNEKDLDSNGGHYFANDKYEVTRNQPRDESRALLQQRSSSSLSSDEERHSGPNTYAAVQQKAARSNIQPENFQPEDYGLEDDRNSDYDEDVIDYGLNPSYNDAIRRSVSSKASSRQRYEDQLDDEYSDVEPDQSTHDLSRAPLALQEAASRTSLDIVSNDWKTPTLKEVIAMLSLFHHVEIQQNAAAYLQHLSFNNDEIKSEIRKLGGIPPLIKLLDSSNSTLISNACGALRNLCYGRKNDRNKLAMKQNDGIPALIRLIRTTKDVDLREQSTGTLWNLSAHPELKGQILELGLEPLTDLIISPYSEMTSLPDSKLKDIVMVDVFINTTGVVRNLSSTDSQESRRKIQQYNGLLPALISVLRSSLESGGIDNKATENCLCILRNLTYKLQDETANWKELYSFENPQETSTNKGTGFSCFGKKDDKGTSLELVDEVPADNPDATGAELLWQPEMSRLYVALLKETLSEEIVEGILGALQNLTHGQWKWAVYARIVVRREKGLPKIIEQVLTSNDQIIRFAAVTMTNLAEDPKNKELLGKFSISNLTSKLPESPSSTIDLSDATTIAVLNCLRLLVDKHTENILHLRENKGVDKIVMINKLHESGKFHARVVKAAGQVLKAIWANTKSRSTLKKEGWNKDHFIPTVTYETLPRNTAPLNRQAASIDKSQSSSRSRSAARRDESSKTVAVPSEPVDRPEQSDRSFAPQTTADSWV